VAAHLEKVVFDYSEKLNKAVMLFI